MKRKKKSELETYHRRKQANQTRLKTTSEEQRKKEAERDKSEQEEAARALVELHAANSAATFYDLWLRSEAF